MLSMETFSWQIVSGVPSAASPGLTKPRPIPHPSMGEEGAADDNADLFAATLDDVVVTGGAAGTHFEGHLDP